MTKGERRPPGASCDDPTASTPNDDASSRKLMRGVFLALLVGILINVAMGLFLDFGELSSALAQVSLVSLVVPFLLPFIIQVIDTLRYKLVFKRFHIRTSFRDGLYNNVIGYFFSNITPGSVGGQPFQIVHFSRLGIDSTIASNVIFSRLLEGNIVQLIMVAVFFRKGIGMMATLGKGSYLISAGMAITIGITIVLTLGFLNPHLLGVAALRMEKSRVGVLIARLIRNPCWAERLSAWSLDLGNGFKKLWAHNVGIMVLDIALFAVDQILWSLALYLPLTVILGQPVPFPEFLLSFVICNLISLFIPTPGAAGSVEAAFVIVLSALTGRPAATLSAILVWRFCTFYLHLLAGALVYFFVPVDKTGYKIDSDGTVRRFRRPKLRKTKAA